MGDMADFVNEQFENAQWDESYQEDPEDEGSPGNLDFMGSYDPDRDPRLKTCKKCNTKYLVWGLLKGKKGQKDRWVLCDSNGRHVCPTVPSSKIEPEPEPKQPNEELEEVYHDLRYFVAWMRRRIRSGEQTSQEEIDSMENSLSGILRDFNRATAREKRPQWQ